ncbi:hypothetical protein Q9295_00640 [Xinfangfangia sp. CPCC 101601]|uniref:Excalibur calcium-binding domain-containing protein n=1 Tax=Pseudogemmobacter lacusdianii TaxID=3069608 RepID=A0ABU0VT12_9RHOB|nr:hypothetical protein [Xinfangfangia sp. CPCC 101601]MDQ2064867.1 hypothetical protein [Xinfangfangia sp. CPCC 101601]
MFRRSAALLFAVPLLAACQPSVPDSGAGVGFTDYNSYIRQNSGAPAVVAQPQAPATAAPAGGFNPAAASAAIDRAQGVTPSAAAPSYSAPAISDGAALGTLDPNRPRGDAPAGIRVESGEMAAAGHAGISDEQDFNAVSSRETIASDKQRIEQNRAQYVVVQPKDLPVRPGEQGPNIVDYALRTTNNPGTQLYTRGGFGLRDPLVACSKYASPDLAQQAFLAKGGPDKDRMGLDPDGDGFACGWDPRPFRTALQ